MCNTLLSRKNEPGDSLLRSEKVFVGVSEGVFIVKWSIDRQRIRSVPLWILIDNVTHYSVSVVKTD